MGQAEAARYAATSRKLPARGCGRGVSVSGRSRPCQLAAPTLMKGGNFSLPLATFAGQSILWSPDGKPAACGESRADDGPGARPRSAACVGFARLFGAKTRALHK